MERKKPGESNGELPQSIKDQLKSGGYAYNESAWEMLKGFPGAFLRHVFHKQIEDRGEAPATDAEDDKESLGY